MTHGHDGVQGPYRPRGPDEGEGSQMTMHDQMAGTRDDPLQGAPAGPEDSGKMAMAKQAAADTAQDVKATARDDAANVARQARSEASRLMAQAKQEAQRQADERG